MQRDEDNESYNPLKDMNLMVDFLHYIERSSKRIMWKTLLPCFGKIRTEQTNRWQR